MQFCHLLKRTASAVRPDRVESAGCHIFLHPRGRTKQANLGGAPSFEVVDTFVSIMASTSTTITSSTTCKYMGSTLGRKMDMHRGSRILQSIFPWCCENTVPALGRNPSEPALQRSRSLTQRSTRQCARNKTTSVYLPNLPLRLLADDMFYRRTARLDWQTCTSSCHQKTSDEKR